MPLPPPPSNPKALNPQRPGRYPPALPEDTTSRLLLSIRPYHGARGAAHVTLAISQLFNPNRKARTLFFSSVSLTSFMSALVNTSPTFSPDLGVGD